ncbi:unnamed protein product, partial [Prorocentrum cordatum]
MVAHGQPAGGRSWAGVVAGGKAKGSWSYWVCSSGQCREWNWCSHWKCRSCGRVAPPRVKAAQPPAAADGQEQPVDAEGFVVQPRGRKARRQAKRTAARAASAGAASLAGVSEASSVQPSAAERHRQEVKRIEDFLAAPGESIDEACLQSLRSALDRERRPPLPKALHGAGNALAKLARQGRAKEQALLKAEGAHAAAIGEREEAIAREAACAEAVEECRAALEAHREEQRAAEARQAKEVGAAFVGTDLLGMVFGLIQQVEALPQGFAAGNGEAAFAEAAMQIAAVRRHAPPEARGRSSWADTPLDVSDEDLDGDEEERVRASSEPPLQDAAERGKAARRGEAHGAWPSAQPLARDLANAGAALLDDQPLATAADERVAESLDGRSQAKVPSDQRTRSTAEEACIGKAYLGPQPAPESGPRDSDGRGCERADWIHHCFAGFAMAAPPVEEASLFLGICKFVGHVRHDVLCLSALRFGFNLKLLRGLPAIFLAPRIALAGGMASAPSGASGAVLAGCACATAAAKLPLLGGLLAAGDQRPLATLRNLEGDVSLQAVGSARLVVDQLVGASGEMLRHLRDHHLPLNEGKSVFLASSAQVADGLAASWAALGFEVKRGPQARNMGTDAYVTSRGVHEGGARAVGGRSRARRLRTLGSAGASVVPLHRAGPTAAMFLLRVGWRLSAGRILHTDEGHALDMLILGPRELGLLAAAGARRASDRAEMTRLRHGAAPAMPLFWDALGQVIGPRGKSSGREKAAWRSDAVAVMWVNRPADGLLGGRLYLDGSALDPEFGCIRRAGWSIVQCDEFGNLQAAVYGTVRLDLRPSQTAKDGEHFAVWLLSRYPGPSFIGINSDCAATVSCLQPGRRYASAANKPNAHLWSVVYASLDVDSLFVNKVEAHCAEIVFRGGRISEGQWLGSAYADRLAKAGAALHRASAAARREFFGTKEVVRGLSRRIAQVSIVWQGRASKGCESLPVCDERRTAVTFAVPLKERAGGLRAAPVCESDAAPAAVEARGGLAGSRPAAAGAWASAARDGGVALGALAFAVAGRALAFARCGEDGDEQVIIACTRCGAYARLGGRPGPQPKLRERCPGATGLPRSLRGQKSPWERGLHPGGTPHARDTRRKGAEAPRLRKEAEVPQGARERFLKWLGVQPGAPAGVASSASAADAAVSGAGCATSSSAAVPAAAGGSAAGEGSRKAWLDAHGLDEESLLSWSQEAEEARLERQS